MALNTVSNWNVGKNEPTEPSLQKLADAIGATTLELRQRQLDQFPAGIRTTPHVDAAARDALYTLWSRLPADRRAQLLVDLAASVAEQDR